MTNFEGEPPIESGETKTPEIQSRPYGEKLGSLVENTVKAAAGIAILTIYGAVLVLASPFECTRRLKANGHDMAAHLVESATIILPITVGAIAFSNGESLQGSIFRGLIVGGILGAASLAGYQLLHKNPNPNPRWNEW